MKTIIPLFITLLLLSSCAAVKVQQVEGRIDAECTPEEKGSFAAHARCRRDIVLQEGINQPGIDIWVAAQNQIIKLGEKYDAGKITKEQYDDQISVIKSQASAQMNAVTPQGPSFGQIMAQGVAKAGQDYYATNPGVIYQPPQIQTRCTSTNAYGGQTVNCVSQ